MDLISRNPQFNERRIKPRVYCNYPALVRGHDPQGKKYEENVRVINFSRGGAYAVLKRAIDNGKVQNGDVLALSIKFPTGVLEWGTPKLATRAVVIRTEEAVDGSFGFAVQFVSFKFM
jgi:hypothetical protein